MEKAYANSKQEKGFSLTEIIVGAAITGTIISVAVPKYVNRLHTARLQETKQIVSSIPPVISAYIDATGEAPSTWEDLSTIAVVMTNNGPATGNLETPKTLPDSIYDLAISRPTESVYTLTATRVIDRVEPDTDDVNASSNKHEFAIKSCFNISNGASDLKSGKLSDIENTLNCR